MARGMRIGFPDTPPAGVPVLDSLSSYGVQAGATGFTLTVTGSGITAGDQIEVWGTLRTTTIISGTSASCPVDTGELADRNFGCVRLARGTERSYALPFEVYDTQTFSSSYVTNASTVIGLTYGATPTKGETRNNDTAGSPLRRVTSVSDQSRSTYTGTYSRYPNISADGKYLWADRENSTAMDLIRRSDLVNLGRVLDGLGTGVNNDIGEFHEPRWNTLGNAPGEMFYMRGMKLCKRDIIANTSEVVIRDFTSDFGAGYLQNDVEGLCSIDCRFWVWQQRDTGLTGGICRRFVRYDLLKNTYTTADHTTLGITADGSGYFSKPNMVESSIRGDRIITHYGRVYPGSRDSEYGTNADMPRSWAPDWTDVKIIAVAETHSGQAFDANMRQVFVSQNDRNDTVEWADTINGGTFRTGTGILDQNHPPANFATNGRLTLLSQATDSGNYAISIGYHVASNISGVRRGFTLVSSYAGEGYIGSQQLRMYRLSDARVWRLGHKPGRYPGTDGYRNEAQPAISHDGTDIIMGGDWNGTLSGANREVFTLGLPRDWHSNAIWA